MGAPEAEAASSCMAVAAAAAAVGTAVVAAGPCLLEAFRVLAASSSSSSLGEYLKFQRESEARKREKIRRVCESFKREERGRVEP